jgi:hypothetical protein
MSWFRVLIYAPTSTTPPSCEIGGYSDAVDLVTACVTQRQLTDRGLAAAILPNTRRVQRDATAFFAQHQGTLGTLTFLSSGSTCCVPCKLPLPPQVVSPETPAPVTPHDQDPCDGK